MRWTSAMTEGADLAVALEQCAAKVRADLGPAITPSLVVAFVSAAYGFAVERVPALLRERFPGAVLFGCSAGGVIGSGQEVEGARAVALTAGHLPGVRIAPFHVTGDNLPTPDDPPDAWVRLVGVRPEERPSFLLLMDPFTAPGEELLAGLDFAFPQAPKVGGIASGGRHPGSHSLYLGTETHRDGAVGLALTGDIAVDTVVAQGCRPIGEPRRVTQCRANLLLELDGEPPMAYLHRLYQESSSRDQELMATNLFLGIAIDPLLTLDDVRPGDFLVRNLIGADAERGAIAVSEPLREGQLVQFHVRDAVSSAEDVKQQLVRYLEAMERERVAGALLFQCNGRGQYLYGRPNHDSSVFGSLVGQVPLGGFFCNGEIGQVGGATYLHGYTSSFAIFRRP